MEHIEDGRTKQDATRNVASDMDGCVIPRNNNQ